MIASILILCSLAAETGGWSAARWGMTEDQVLAAIPPAVRLTSPEKFRFGQAPIAIPEFRAEQSTFRVLFIMTPDLSRIVFSDQDGSEEEFVRVESLLVRKYGRPWHRSGGILTISQWTRGDTVITLRRVVMRAIRSESIDLTYERVALSGF
jgi:hypothetical protein